MTCDHSLPDPLTDFLVFAGDGLANILTDRLRTRSPVYFSRYRPPAVFLCNDDKAPNPLTLSNSLRTAVATSKATGGASALMASATFLVPAAYLRWNKLSQPHVSHL